MTPTIADVLDAIMDYIGRRKTYETGKNQYFKSGDYRHSWDYYGRSQREQLESAKKRAEEISEQYIQSVVLQLNKALHHYADKATKEGNIKP